MEQELPSQAALLVTVVEAHHSEERETDLLADAVAQSGACLDPDTILVPGIESDLDPVDQTGEAELAPLEMEASLPLNFTDSGSSLQLREDQKSEQHHFEQQLPEQQLPEQQLPEQQLSEQQLPEQQPVEEEPVEEQPVEEQPVEEQPVEGQPVEGQPVEEQPVEGQPVEGQPSKQHLLEQQPTAVSQTPLDKAVMAELLSGSPVKEPQSHKHEEVAPTLQNGEEGLEPPEQPPKPAEETPSRYKPAMLKLMAMLASQEPPTPTKSLPSKMERLTFRNSTPARKVPEKAKAYKTYFRQQSASSQTGPSAYACQKCSFRTSRMDNLVRHNKADCAFVKDFFSWDANTFTEATQLPKKRSLSPDTNGGVVASMAETSVPKRKGVPRRYLELSSKSSDRRKSTPSSQSKSQPESIEDGSDPEDELSLSNATPREEFEFSEDDVVWVEWKRLHWPALVLKLYPSTRKAKVFLIDSITSKETVMINVKKIFDFNSAERTKRFLNEGRVGRNSGALVKAVQKAEEFLRKRCLGININARQFFCDEEVRFTEDPPSEASDDSYVDCSQASPEELGSQGGSDTLSEAAQASKERRKLRNEKLVDCIKGGKVNSHLLGVLNGTVPSERHKRFHSNVQSDRIQLKQWSWFGPIDNASQQEEIYEFCFELLKANSDLDDTFDIASYVIEVWCPEAVMKALCRVRRVQMDRAEEILVRAVVPSVAEYEMKCREMLSIPPTPEEKREHKERLRTEFRDLGIADDILAALEF